MDRYFTLRVRIRKYYCKNMKYRIYIYMIGLTHLDLIPGKQVIVQLSKSVTLTPKLLHLNVQIQDLENDPYLSEIPVCLRPQVLQTIYVHVYGLRLYIIFFAGIGKCSFLSTFFQYASCGQSSGSIGRISLDHSDHSMYSFLLSTLDCMCLHLSTLHSFLFITLLGPHKTFGKLIRSG